MVQRYGYPLSYANTATAEADGNTSGAPDTSAPAESVRSDAT